MNIPEEIIVYFQLQKELLRLEITTKALSLLAVSSLLFALISIGFGLLYVYIGLIAAILYVALWLMLIAFVSLYRVKKINRLRLQKEEAATAVQMQLKNRLSHTEPSPDLLLNLFQTFRMISDIIHEVKNLFQEKG